MRARAGVYILAATCIELDRDLDEIRKQLIKLAKPYRRIHWRDAEQSQQRRILTTLVKLPALHTVVVETKLDPRKQERSRRHCLERLLYELSAAGISQVILENRTESLNRYDRSAMDAFRTRGLISDKMRISHVRPDIDPLLWLPDVIAGIVGSELDGGKDVPPGIENILSRFNTNSYLI